MASPPPLNGIRVLEFAGLAPGPFAGMMLADWGAHVLRVDRATTTNRVIALPDQLTRRKSSVVINLEDAAGVALVTALVPKVDVIIDPFRAGALEKMGLGPDVLLRLNPRVVIARMTGFRSDGRYSKMAGHDINSIAVSGVLGMLGPARSLPIPPGILMGSFAGGGLVCFLGIVLALYARHTTGKGQIVEANMVDGSSYIATGPRLALKTSLWSGPRGTNLLDGGCPYYNVYQTKDGLYVAVGALEPQFFDKLLQGLGLEPKDLPGERSDRTKWTELAELLTRKFESKTRAEWEAIFDGTDACVTPILTNAELERQGYEQRPAVALKGTPALPVTEAPGKGWNSGGLDPGTGGREVLKAWAAWQEGREYKVERNVYSKMAVAAKL